MGRSTWDDTRRDSTARNVTTCSHVQSTNPSAPSNAEQLGATHTPKSHCPGGGMRTPIPSRHRVTPEHHPCLQARLKSKLAGVPTSNRPTVRTSSHAGPHAGDVWDALQRGVSAAGSKHFKAQSRGQTFLDTAEPRVHVMCN